MLRIDHPLPHATPGCSLSVTRWHFGRPGARPKVYIQAALHADELPGVLVAHQLKERLAALEAAGQLLGEVIVIPVANPQGLAQFHNGTHMGRFEGHSGRNFNRGFPDLVDSTADLLRDQLGGDADTNIATTRQCLARALQARPAPQCIDALQQHLFGLAQDADIVLDLHCDSEAEVHLYAHSEQLEAAQALGAFLGAAAILHAQEQGGQSFDDALTRQWYQLGRRFPDRHLPCGCIALTVELRGQSNVDNTLAAQDAQGIVQFLGWSKVLTVPDQATPPPSRFTPTPLNCCEILSAPASGVLHYVEPTGTTVQPGQVLALVIDPVTGEEHTIRAVGAGMYFARLAHRYVAAGTEVCFIAGDTLVRNTDQLLSA